MMMIDPNIYLKMFELWNVIMQSSFRETLHIIESFVLWVCPLKQCFSHQTLFLVLIIPIIVLHCVPYCGNFISKNFQLTKIFLSCNVHIDIVKCLCYKIFHIELSPLAIFHLVKYSCGGYSIIKLFLLYDIPVTKYSYCKIFVS